MVLVGGGSGGGDRGGGLVVVGWLGVEVVVLVGVGWWRQGGLWCWWVGTGGLCCLWVVVEGGGRGLVVV